MKISDNIVMENMNEKQRLWLAYALAAIVGADSHIDAREYKHLEKGLTFLKDDDKIMEILDLAQSGELPKLPILEIERPKAFQILLYLGGVAIADEDMSKEEINVFKFIGAKLGFEHRFSVQLVRVLCDSLTIDIQIKRLEHLAKSMEPAYHQL